MTYLMSAFLVMTIAGLIFAVYGLIVGEHYNKATKAFFAATDAFHVGDWAEGRRRRADGERLFAAARKFDVFNLGGNE